jgi:hypothetical protein
MCKNLFSLRGAVLAAALVAASATASAANFNASFNFDNVASGSVADTALGSYSPLIHFGNAGTVLDDPVYDSVGNLLNDGAFHWVDATATYGAVQAKNDGTAVSPSNVLWNDHQPILVMFAAPQTISAFSIQQDTSGFGSPGGSHMAFLDSTGHEIAGASFAYTSFGNPGLTIQSNGTWANVSGVLLSGDTSYDNMSVTAVPEPESWAMLSGGLLLLGVLKRRKLS